MKWTFANKLTAASVIIATCSLIYAIASNIDTGDVVPSDSVAVTGTANTTLAGIDGGAGGVSISINPQAEEGNQLKPLENIGKIVPYDIMKYLNVGTPLSSVSEILGNPLRIHEGVSPLFGREVSAQQLLFEFRNFRIGVESTNGMTIDALTFDNFYEDHSPINIDPFQHTNIGKIELGTTTFSKVLKHCAPSNAEYFRSSKDAYFAMECPFGNVGNYYTYTFGCYCFTIKGSKFKDGNIITRKGEVLDLGSQMIDFITIARDEGRGHPLYYQGFR